MLLFEFGRASSPRNLYKLVKDYLSERKVVYHTRAKHLLEAQLLERESTGVCCSGTWLKYLQHWNRDLTNTMMEHSVCSTEWRIEQKLKLIPGKSNAA